ncbi:MAG: hypothetical protein HY699_14885 [Deltaproteobacteria bacterium]|nr:hypothetical protein [Deltaproteobacteria bacterium]
MPVGDELGPRRRSAPLAEQIAAYVGAGSASDFADLALAVGRPGMVVPGPMLAAFLEHFLRAELSGWRLEHLSTTFRVPSIAGEALSIRGAVTEHHEQRDRERIVCDLIIEHVDGQPAVTGTATLWRARPKDV